MKLNYYIFIFSTIFCNCGNIENNSKSLPKKIVDIEKIKSNNIFPRTYDNDNFIDLDTDKFKIKDGSYIGLFIDSTIAFTGRFNSGKQDGIFHFFYRNGRVRNTEIYSNGIEDGNFAYYDSSGIITECGQYKLGKRDGVWYSWWDFKTLRSKKKYINDKEEGEDFYYYKNGQIETISFSKNGFSEGKYIHYFENGNIETEGNYHLGYQVGLWKSYYTNQKVKNLEYFVEEIGLKEKKIINVYKNQMGSIYFPIKTWFNYDSLGNVKSKIYYDNNYKVKQIEKLNKAGNIISSIEYNGQTFYTCSRNPGYRIKDGKELEYYENGKIKILGTNKMNQKNGTWFYYDSLGVLTKTELYINDTLITK